MSSPICWMKNNIFSDTSQRASKKCENWRNHFSRHRNIIQNKKIFVKHVQQKKRQQGFFSEKRKTEKESLTEVYKDSKKCEER